MVSRLIRKYNIKPQYVPAFLFLHEATAIAPMPIFFGFFYLTDTSFIPSYFERKALEYSEKILGHDTGIQLISQLASAYALNKVIMPLRISFCLYYTPRFTTFMQGFFKRMFRKTK
jgi:hypothetical protein